MELTEQQQKQIADDFFKNKKDLKEMFSFWCNKLNLVENGFNRADMFYCLFKFGPKVEFTPEEKKFKSEGAFFGHIKEAYYDCEFEYGAFPYYTFEEMTEEVPDYCLKTGYYGE